MPLVGVVVIKGVLIFCLLPSSLVLSLDVMYECIIPKSTSVYNYRLTNHIVYFISLCGLTNHDVNFMSLRGLTNHGIDATDSQRTIYVKACHVLMASSLQLRTS